MRQFTIAERLIAASLLPLAALVAVHFSIGVLAPYLGLPTAGQAEIAAGAVVIALMTTALWALGKSIARALANAADSLDAMACAELGGAPPIETSRNEVVHILAATDRLAEVLGERQRREIVHSDLDRTWQASRRINLSGLAGQVETATTIGIQPVIDGAATLQAKAEDMSASLETVHAAFEEPRSPPKARAP